MTEYLVITHNVNNESLHKPSEIPTNYLNVLSLKHLTLLVSSPYPIIETNIINHAQHIELLHKVDETWFYIIPASINLEIIRKVPV